MKAAAVTRLLVHLLLSRPLVAVDYFQRFDFSKQDEALARAQALYDAIDMAETQEVWFPDYPPAHLDLENECEDRCKDMVNSWGSRCCCTAKSTLYAERLHSFAANLTEVVHEYGCVHPTTLNKTLLALSLAQPIFEGNRGKYNEACSALTDKNPDSRLDTSLFTIVKRCFTDFSPVQFKADPNAGKIRFLTVSGDGKSLYVTCSHPKSEGESFYAYDIDPITRALSNKKSYSGNTDAFYNTVNNPSEISLWQPVLSPDDQFLYLSSGRNDDTANGPVEGKIFSFARDLATGDLSGMVLAASSSSTEPFEEPRQLVISPDGRFLYAATKGRIVQWTRDNSTGALSNYVGLDFGVGSPGHPLLCDLHAKDGSVLPTGNDQFVSLAISPKDGNFLYALVTANGLTGEMRAQATNCPTMAQRNADGEITYWNESTATRCTSHYAGSSQLYLLDRNTTSGSVSNFRTAEGRCPSHGEPGVNQEISCRRITWGHPKDLIDGRRKLYVSCNTGGKNFEVNGNGAEWHALHMWKVDESGGLSYGGSVATGNIDNINFDFLTSKTEPRRVFMNGQEVPAACYKCQLQDCTVDEDAGLIHCDRDHSSYVQSSIPDHIYGDGLSLPRGMHFRMVDVESGPVKIKGFQGMAMDPEGSWIFLGLEDEGIEVRYIGPALWQGITDGLCKKTGAYAQTGTLECFRLLQAQLMFDGSTEAELLVRATAGIDAVGGGLMSANERDELVSTKAERASQAADVIEALVQNLDQTTEQVETSSMVATAGALSAVLEVDGCSRASTFDKIRRVLASAAAHGDELAAFSTKSFELLSAPGTASAGLDLDSEAASAATGSNTSQQLLPEVSLAQQVQLDDSALEDQIIGKFSLHVASFRDGKVTADCFDASAKETVHSVTSIVLANRSNHRPVEDVKFSFKKPIRFLLRKPPGDEDGLFECSFFDRKKKVWSKRGCETASSHVRCGEHVCVKCLCVHLTEFALIRSLASLKAEHGEQAELSLADSPAWPVFAVFQLSAAALASLQLGRALHFGAWKAHRLMTSLYLMMALVMLLRALGSIAYFLMQSETSMYFFVVINSVSTTLELVVFLIIMMVWKPLNSHHSNMKRLMIYTAMFGVTYFIVVFALSLSMIHVVSAADDSKSIIRSRLASLIQIGVVLALAGGFVRYGSLIHAKLNTGNFVSKHSHMVFVATLAFGLVLLVSSIVEGASKFVEAKSDASAFMVLRGFMVAASLAQLGIILYIFQKPLAELSKKHKALHGSSAALAYTKKRGAVKPISEHSSRHFTPRHFASRSSSRGGSHSPPGQKREVQVGPRTSRKSGAFTEKTIYFEPT